MKIILGCLLLIAACAPVNESEVNTSLTKYQWYSTRPGSSYTYRVQTHQEFTSSYDGRDSNFLEQWLFSQNDTLAADLTPTADSVFPGAVMSRFVIDNPIGASTFTFGIDSLGDIWVLHGSPRRLPGIEAKTERVRGEYKSDRMDSSNGVTTKWHYARICLGPEKLPLESNTYNAIHVLDTTYYESISQSGDTVGKMTTDNFWFVPSLGAIGKRVTDSRDLFTMEFHHRTFILQQFHL